MHINIDSSDAESSEKSSESEEQDFSKHQMYTQSFYQSENTPKPTKIMKDKKERARNESLQKENAWNLTLNPGNIHDVETPIIQMSEMMSSSDR